MKKYGFIIILFFLSVISAFAEVLREGSGNIIPTETELEETHLEITDTAIGFQTGSPEYYRSLKSPFGISEFFEDTNLLRFVSRDTSLKNQKYAPSDLVSISGANINEAGRKSYLRQEAQEGLFLLAKEFQKTFDEPLVVISGYRSAAYQKRLWDLGKCTSTLCAPPGYSEHQLGLAVDLFDATTAREFESNKRYRNYVGWLQENAHKYGWTQSYQKGAEVDMYEVEPWHWRYVGTPMATRLHNLGWTYTEFVRFQEAIQKR